MTREEAIKELVELAESDDTESAHVYADKVLCELLEELGYSDVVRAYTRIGKWYS